MFRPRISMELGLVRIVVRSDRCPFGSVSVWIVVSSTRCWFGSFVQAGCLKSCIYKSSGVDREPLPSCDRLLDAQRGESRANQILERDWGSSPFPDRFFKSAPLSAMTLILAPAGVNRLLASIADQFETPKILQDRNRDSAENFEALLGKSAVAVRKIADGSFRAIGETNRDEHIIAAVVACISEGPPFNLS